MNFEKSMCYDNRFKLVSKLGTAPLTAHNFSNSAEFINICIFALGPGKALIDIDNITPYFLSNSENMLSSSMMLDTDSNMI